MARSMLNVRAFKKECGSLILRDLLMVTPITVKYGGRNRALGQFNMLIDGATSSVEQGDTTIGDTIDMFKNPRVVNLMLDRIPSIIIAR